MREAISGKFVGHSVKRVEDRRLLTGTGTFVADVEPEGVAHAAFLRSPFAHAEIVSIDTTAAKLLPGVVDIFTGADIEEVTNPFIPLSTVANQYVPIFYALSSTKVRLVGDPIAIVVAENRYIAEDALELIDVEYNFLDPIGTMDQALDPRSAQIWEKADGNVLMDDTSRYGNVDKVFAKADHVFTETFDCHRQSNQPMETRGAVAEIDPITGDVTFHATTQAAHALRWYLAMTTNKATVRKSVRALVGNRDRVKKFYRGAKSVVAPNIAELKTSDSGASAYQMKRDRSTPIQLGRMFINTLAADKFPRVVAQDIGGAFGSKGPVNREDVAVLVAAQILNRSVKWIEDRSENLADGGQAREERMTISVACSTSGEIQGFKVDLVMDQGAYPAVPMNTGLFAGIIRVMMPGTYRLKAFEINTKVVASNKGRYVQYRGPWANETWVRERMIDVVARELGMSPTDIRLQNMYSKEQLPSAMITGPDMDKEMTAKLTLEEAIKLADLPAFSAAKLAAEAEGRYLGVGFCTFHEAAPGPPNFSASVTPGIGFALAEPVETVLEADGTVTIKTQQMPHGQSHETTYAQLAADELGLPIEAIRLQWGDTDDTPFGLLGTGGSRGGPIGGGAVKYSTRELRSQILQEAADLLEANIDDLQITDGKIHVAGVPAISRSFSEVAASVKAKKSGANGQLETSIRYSGEGDGGWAVATHVCFVEVNLETGFVTIPRYIVVEDCGTMINPAIVEGQVRGGVAQGIGAVLYEKLTYDDEANFQASTYMDYLIPTAMEIPDIEIHHIETPSAVEANYRGVGEGGMIAAPAALTNAIEDALSSKGVKIREQHLPPTRILELAGVIPETRI